MKTTIDLPDDLLVAAKKRAAELRRPMRELVERGLRRELGERADGARRATGGIRWITVAGGLPPGLDLRDRAAMHARIGRHQ